MENLWNHIPEHKLWAYCCLKRSCDGFTRKLCWPNLQVSWQWKKLKAASAGSDDHYIQLVLPTHIMIWWQSFKKRNRINSAHDVFWRIGNERVKVLAFEIERNVWLWRRETDEDFKEGTYTSRDLDRCLWKTPNNAVMSQYFIVLIVLFI